MRQFKNLLYVATCFSVLLGWGACQKGVSNQSLGNQSRLVNNNANTVAADDPVLVSKTPTIMSSSFLANARYSVNSSDVSMAKAPRGGGGGSTSDVTPPAVSITSPANGATVSGIVTVSVSASDNVGVAKVSFSVDGTLQNSLTAAPYNFSWNSDNVIDGTHTLSATAYDAKGNNATATITVAKQTTIIITNPGPLPSVYLLTTPPVGDQGYQELTCTPFASVYAARSIEQYCRTSATSYNYATNIFSVEYVYNQTKISSDCNSGTSITLTLDLMKNKGVCTWNTMPYTDGDCATQPTASQNAEAANYKIGNYSKMLNTDSVAIKTMITQKHPVIFSVVMDNSFTNAGPGFIWSSYSGSGSLPHCMIICGYDNAKHAYKVMNSWGTSWGDAGYSWIDYDFFPVKTGYYVYAMNY